MREKHVDEGGLVYRVVLVLNSGEEVPLLAGYGGAQALHVRAAEQIRSALGHAATAPALPG